MLLFEAMPSEDCETPFEEYELRRDLRRMQLETASGVYATRRGLF